MTEERTIPSAPFQENKPVAWLINVPGRYDVVHDEVKSLWLNVIPGRIENYTIPLYRIPDREPLSTEAARELIVDSLGIDPILDGNLLKMLRSVERAHGIGTPYKGDTP